MSLITNSKRSFSGSSASSASNLLLKRCSKYDKACPFYNVRNILVLSAGSLSDIKFSISQKAINHLIQSSGYPSLKIAKCWAYLEAGLLESMKNSNLMCSVLSTSAPSAFSSFFTLETNVMGGGGSHTAGGKPLPHFTHLLIAIFLTDS